VNRQPLSDELPYHFIPPRLNPACLWLARRLGPGMLLRDHQVVAVAFEGDVALRGKLGRGDGVLLCPNHTDHADSQLMFALSDRVGVPFYYMIAYQILQGHRRWFLPRIGAFPVDREGADLTAFKTAVDLLARGGNPLVIFPEGEIHHLGDRVTPLREGALAVATTAARRAAERGQTVWLVPVATKYHYLDPPDPVPALHAALDDLERRANWRVDRARPLVERVYRYAEGMLGLKETEYFGAARSGPLPGRLAALREFLLARVEAKRLPAARRRATVCHDIPERVKDVRRACLDALAAPGVTDAERRALRADLHDVFVAFQTSSYPGDYVREGPTVERVAETLMKFEEDFLGVHEVTPHAPRTAVVRFGEPVDVGSRVAAATRPRRAVAALTSELGHALQSLLDALGPGRPLPPAECARAPDPAAGPPGRVV
jgi:1-acyl-sn-glycerol-3-phosphate acyltransferase